MAARNLGTLTIDLIARIGGFIKGMTEAERVADRSSREIARKHKARAAEVEKAWQNLKSIGLAFTAVGAAAGAAFIAVNRVAQSIDALNDSADATGSSIENLSALEDIAVRTGTEFQTVTSAIVKFNDVLQDADANKGAGAVLKALNLDIEELKRLDPAEALRQVAVALSGFANDGNKARAAQVLFGKSIREVAPFLKDLAEAGQLNATVTRQQAEEAEKFTKNVAAMEKNLADAGRTIFSSFVPALNEILKTFNSKGLLAALDTFGNRAFDWENTQTRKQVKILQSDIADLQKQASAVGGGFVDKVQKLGLGGTIAAAFSGDINEIEREIAEKTRQLNRLQNRLGIGIPQADYSNEGRGPVQRSLGPINTAASGAGGKAKAEIDEVAKALAELQEQLALFDQDDSFTKAFKLEGLGATTAQLAEYRDALAKLEELKADKQITATIDALVKERDELGLTNEALTIHRLVLQGASEGQIQYAKEVIAATQAAKDQQAAIDEGKRIYEQTRTPAESLNIELGKLNDLLQKGAIDWDTYSRAVFAAQDKFDATIKKTEEVTDTFTKRFAENVQDTLGQGLYDILDGNFKNIGKSFVQMVNRMVAEAAAADIARRLFGDLVKGGSGSGSLGGLFSSFGSFFMHQGGIAGVDGSPTRYHTGGIAGLRPDEVPAILRKGEEVLTRGDPRHRSNGGSYSPTFNIPANVDKRTIQQVEAAAFRGAMRAKSRGTA
jgi:hypothetical protein